MTLDDLAKDIADTVKESVSDALKSISEKYDARIAELEKRLAEIPAPVKGDKGDSVTVEDVRPILEELVKGIEIPAPVKGDDGISPSADEIAKSMEHIFSKWALDFERKADGYLERAIDRMPKAKDGRDALEIEDFDLSIGEDGRTITASLKRGQTVIEKSVTLSIPLDAGVYSDNSQYQKGDGVTYAGSFWISQKDSPEGRPGSSDDWRLSVKRGRDGREIVKLDKPQTVKVGV